MPRGNQRLVKEAGDLVVLPVRVNMAMYEMMRILAKSCNLPVDTLAERYLADGVERSFCSVLKTATELKRKNGVKKR